jgi:chemotaxis protein methyltransferase CheR
VPSPQSHDLEQLRELVALRLGLAFSDDKLDFLANVAEKRREANACASFQQYFELVAAPGRGAVELRSLAEDLTVTETFFFRNADHFRALTAGVLDAAHERGQRRLRILSAGCASGEEPYSLAMCLRDAIPDFARWDVRISAVDMNRAMLAKAARGSYGAWSLRATPESIKNRYFVEKGREFQLDPSIREMVSFEERNLAVAEPGFWSALAWDVVFCRNVLMYFTPEVMRRVVSDIARALVPGGLLFLGHAETLRGLSDEYHLCHTHDTFYYRRRGLDEPRAGQQSVALNVPELPAVVDSAASWVDAIKDASERIAALAGAHAELRRAPLSPTTNGSASIAAVRGHNAELARVLDLMRNERFAEATAILRALPPGASEDPDVLLLLCVLLTNQGALEDAERACQRLLAINELHAGAHYLMALCREHAADPKGAAQHDQSAIYLDPGFSMPHLHLGLLAKRAGDRSSARRALAQALLLLSREDASRLLLFGGGFSREALTLLCRAELSGLGGDS